ncbi:hypothetical protein [Aquihabitans sp. McL0605]|uniref:hypothetical protein n=1 Tax=Aquihabitans sp. McL0605 TaxID=3415671 RepID=UPI003CE6962D
MAVPTPPRGPSAPKGVIPSEWPAQAADTIVDTIAMVRDRTTKPLLLAARAVVYGIIAAVVGAITFFLVLLMIVRWYDVWAPGPVWPIYAFFAIVFCIGGLVCLRKANAPKQPETL